MIEFENYDYLRSHGITTLEDLVGLAVYIAYPAQGIKNFRIRKIEYTLKKREWFVVTDSTHRLSELGDGLFFDEEEARIYQLAKLEEYTKTQRERILQRERQLKEKELDELERLLKKYPDEESRKRPVKNCSTCKNNVEFPPPHTCDICTSLDQDEEYEMWEAKE